MACSIKQPKNTFSASFLKSYNQKGIFSKDYTDFFPLLLLHINILPHFPCPLLLFSRRESNHQPMEHWASFTATPGNSTVPQHFTLARTGAVRGNQRLPHWIVTSSTQRRKYQTMLTLLLQESPFPSCTKVTEGFALSHAGSTFCFYPWKAVHKAH